MVHVIVRTMPVIFASKIVNVTAYIIGAIGRDEIICSPTNNFVTAEKDNADACDQHFFSTLLIIQLFLQNLLCFEVSDPIRWSSQ